MEPFDTEEFADVAERERVAGAHGAAFPAGLMWTVHGVSLTVPTLVVGFPPDVDPGLLPLLDDPAVEVDAFGPVRWGTVYEFGEDVAAELADGAALDPDDDRVQATGLIATLRLVALSDFDEDDEAATHVSRQTLLHFDLERDASLLATLVTRGWLGLTLPQLRDPDDNLALVQVDTDSLELHDLLRSLGRWDPSLAADDS
jgi:hypothetical protein